jgi:hypothetical protein
MCAKTTWQLSGIMREKLTPAAITVKCCQGKEGLIARQRPELSGELESALVLRTG